MQNYTYNTLRKAFTMLEMVFVIVILGVIAGISAELIATSYESYINQRAMHRASMKTELAATQIANRLSAAIPGSIVERNGDGTASTLVDIKDIAGTVLNNNTTLQWIGYDIDSFTSRSAGTTAANRRPGWSGFIDLDPTSTVRTSGKIVLSTPGSNLALTDTIIKNLSGTTHSSSVDSAIYFPQRNIHNGNSDADAYTQISDAANDRGVHRINAVAGETITLNTSPTDTIIREQYKLAWTSYAIVPVADDPDDIRNDLELRYNFQPWNGETYNSTSAGNRLAKILIKDISVFRFTGSSNSIRFKLCKQERTGGTAANPTFIAICKEKVIVR